MILNSKPIYFFCITFQRLKEEAEKKAAEEAAKAKADEEEMEVFRCVTCVLTVICQYPN